MTTPLNDECVMLGGRGEPSTSSRSDTHFVKALPPIFFMAAGSSRRVSPLHSRNEALPMVVQAAGMIIVWSEAHFSKALSPMLVTEMGSVMADSALRHRLASYLAAHDYGNESEVNKIYKLLDT